MNGLNKVFLLGSLGAKPELRFTQGGTPVLSLRLATNERYQNKDKEWVDRTEWHSCTVFGARAEGLSKILDKGSSLLIEGSLRTSSYEKDGVKRYRTEVIVGNVHLSGGKSHDADGEEQRGNNNGEDDGGSAPRGRSGGGGATDGDFTVNFGRDKGKKISEVEDLSWLRGKFATDLTDESKSRFHDKTRKQIASIDAELARRGGGGAAPARSGGGYAPRGGGRAASRVEPEQSGAPGESMGDGGGSDDFDYGNSEDDEIPF